MKKVWLTGLAMLCGLGLHADVLLERFDSEALSGKLIGGAVIAPGEGLEQGALKVSGNRGNYQYFYNYDIAAKPGEKYAVALNYRTSEKFDNGALMLMVTFVPEKGKKAPASLYFRLYRSHERWSHRRFEFTMPEGAVKAQIRLRMSGAPADYTAWVDFLRAAPVKDGVAKGIDLEEFETAFDGWQFDKQLIFDHFMIGPGGKIRNEWREAKVGEAFFQANGNGSAMQYALYIENIRVKPLGNYIFEAFYQATDDFKFNSNGMLIFFYKDAQGKAIGQSRFFIKSTRGQWKELLHTFTVPEKCAFVDIGLNIRRINEKHSIKLDHLRFKPAADKAEVRIKTDSGAKVMQVNTLLTGKAASAKVQKRSYIIQDAAGKTVKKLSAPASGAMEIGLKDFADGEYFLIAEMTLAEGRTLTADAKKFSVFCNPDWYNDIGIQKPETAPPAPWKALASGGKFTVENWNGKLEFAPNLLLKSIVSCDGKRVAGAMEIAVNGQALPIAGQPFAVKPSMASAGGKGLSGDVVCDMLVTTDYAGFTRYTLTLKAEKETDLKSLKLNFSVPEAEFIHRTDGSWTDVGAVELTPGKVWETKHFYDNIMFGNVERGISFFCENAYPAKRDFRQVWAKCNGKNLQIDLINEPLTLKKGKSAVFEFALCAYPFRPAEKNWRKLRFRAGKNSNFDLTWHRKDTLKYAGSMMIPASPEKTRKHLQNKAEYQLIYQIPLYICEKIPAWSFFCDKWKILPSRSYDMGELGMLYKGDFRERSWSDLYIKAMVEVLKEYPWDGVYYDCFGTDVFTVNGESFNPVFALYGLHERIYNAQRLHNPKSLTVTHAGADQGGSMGIFSNVILMGEQYRGDFRTASYYSDFMTMNRFRYEAAVNIGADRMLLPQYRQTEKINSPQVATHVVGMALLHNLMLYPNFIRKDIELSVRDRLYAFGLENAEFHGYWQAGEKIGTGNSDVYASFYSNAKGYFATVLNYSKTAKKCTLKVPFKFSSATVFDPVSGKSIPFSGTLDLAPAMAKFIEFKR